MKVPDVNPADLASVSRGIRHHVLDMALRTKTSHLGPSLCIADILAVLYFRVLDLRPEDPNWADRDRFILSKGHAAASLYATMALRGYFPAEELHKYCVDGGRFHGHPCRHDAPGIEFSSGSLGHGLSVAVGIALGLNGKTNANVYALLGDGECNEGSVWEAATFAATHHIKNIVAIIDANSYQGFSATHDIDRMKLAKKWEAFGWRALEVNGHDLGELEATLRIAKASQEPTVVIAKTISGKGMRSIEDTLLAHYFVPDQAAVDAALNDLYAQ